MGSLLIYVGIAFAAHKITDAIDRNTAAIVRLSKDKP